MPKQRRIEWLPTRRIMHQKLYCFLDHRSPTLHYLVAQSIYFSLFPANKLCIDHPSLKGRINPRFLFQCIVLNVPVGR
jgi:hypothetical protein